MAMLMISSPWLLRAEQALPAQKKNCEPALLGELVRAIVRSPGTYL